MSTDIFFYLFAAITAGSALAVVLCKNTVAAALSLLVSLVGVAALFILLDAFLLAALMVFVYAGAVVALFLFIVMLIDTYGGTRKPFKKRKALSSYLEPLQQVRPKTTRQFLSCQNYGKSVQKTVTLKILSYECFKEFSLRGNNFRSSITF